MQFTNPTTVPTSFTVSGGTIDNVRNAVAVGSGTVDSVTTVLGPVTPDTASVIARVSTSVPWAYQTTFFWPAISGESFPPTFSSYTYTQYRNIPCYQGTASIGSNNAVFPNIPRASVDGKTNMLFKFLLATTIAPSIGNTLGVFSWGTVLSPSSWPTGANAAGISIGVDSNGKAVMAVTDGAGNIDTITSGVTVNDGGWHSIEIDLSTAGAATLIVDGVAAGASGNRLPTTNILTSLTPKIASGAAGNLTRQTQLLITYT